MAYIAGLVDGEGCITCTQRLEHRKGKPRAYKYWNIRIEVAMTHKETIEYLMTGQLPNDGNHDGMAHHKPVKHGNLDALD